MIMSVVSFGHRMSIFMQSGPVCAWVKGNLHVRNRFRWPENGPKLPTTGPSRGVQCPWSCRQYVNVMVWHLQNSFVVLHCLFMVPFGSCRKPRISHISGYVAWHTIPKGFFPHQNPQFDGLRPLRMSQTGGYISVLGCIVLD